MVKTKKQTKKRKRGGRRRRRRKSKRRPQGSDNTDNRSTVDEGQDHQWAFIKDTFTKNRKTVLSAAAMAAVNDIYGYNVLSFLGPIVFAGSKILLDLADFSPTVMIDGFIDKYTDGIRDAAIIMKSGHQKLDDINAKKKARLVKEIRKQKALLKQFGEKQQTKLSEALKQEKEEHTAEKEALEQELKIANAFSILGRRAWPSSCRDLPDANLSDVEEEAINFLKNDYCEEVAPLLSFKQSTNRGGGTRRRRKGRRRRKSRRRRGKRRSTRRRRRRSR